MGKDDYLVSELAALRSMGIKLLVDDFGTGYSSLSQLQRLNFDVLKVDTAFTSALGKSKKGEVFFKTIIWMAHALGMPVVTEDVETTEQLRVMQRLACADIQGHLIARPDCAVEMETLMAREVLIPQTASHQPVPETV